MFSGAGKHCFAKTTELGWNEIEARKAIQQIKTYIKGKIEINRF
jgi:hypothetical protein